ncbi:MAG TPA: hypothetical protein VHZ33_17685 [Trebonia sp.]|nr:hypothetical protein [Trebonia sp.]
MFRSLPRRPSLFPRLLRRLGPPPQPPRRHFSRRWYAGHQAVARRPAHR